MLEAIGVSHTFNPGTPFSRPSLRGVGLRLAPGEVLLITGPSGSGKTTLARILSGLLRPTRGVVHLNGSALHATGKRDRSITKRVVLACQYPERQFFANTLWDEVAWGLRVGLGLGEEEITSRLTSMSAELAFPLADLANRSPRSLSSGQQRKAALLSLLVLEPQVLILDEPLAGLNAKERSRLASFLSRWTDHDKIMLIISHELELFLEWVDTTAVMDQGKIVFTGSPQDLCHLTDASVREAASLPPIVQISYYLKQLGLSDGPVALHWPVVRDQLRNVFTQKTALLGSHTED